MTFASDRRTGSLATAASVTAAQANNVRTGVLFHGLFVIFLRIIVVIVLVLVLVLGRVAGAPNSSSASCGAPRVADLEIGAPSLRFMVPMHAKKRKGPTHEPDRRQTWL